MHSHEPGGVGCHYSSEAFSMGLLPHMHVLAWHTSCKPDRTDFRNNVIMLQSASTGVRIYCKTRFFRVPFISPA